MPGDAIELQGALFGPAELPPPPPAAVGGKGNPCVRVWGLDPAGRRCGSCAHLYRKKYANTYYKCELRSRGLPEGGGPSTDHRVGWPACSRFLEREEAP